MSDITQGLRSIDDTKFIDTKVFNGDSDSFLNISDGFKVAHMNIRSARRNFNEFCAYLRGLPVKMDVIALTEAWLDERDSFQFSLPGYSVFPCYAKYNKSDGQLILCREDLDASVSTVAEIVAANVCAIKFSLNGNSFLINSVYRPPSCNSESFVVSFNTYLERISAAHANQYHIIVGYMNIDIAPNFSDNDCFNTVASEYLDGLASLAFYSAINVVTRDSGTAKSCLDHIFVKCADHQDCEGIIDKISITDHYLTSLLIKTENKNKNNVKLPETYNRIDYVALENLLSNENWEQIIETQDANQSAALFTTILSEHVKSCTTEIKVKCKEKKLKTWITVGLIKCIRKRNKMSLELKGKPEDETLREKFTKYRNKLNAILKEARITFYRNKFMLCFGNLARTWRTIKEVTSIKKDLNNVIYQIVKKNGAVLRNSQEVADYLNEYYSNVAIDLAKTIPKSGPPDHNIFPETIRENQQSLFLTPVDEYEIIKHINCLKNTGSIDGLKAEIYKKMKTYIAKPLSHIVNCCFENGTFPDICKQAHITPIPKSGDKTSADNWRPVCSVSVLSKIVEMSTKDRLLIFLEQHNFFAESQCGFLPGRSTDDAILQICNKAYNALNNSKHSLGIFLDLRKAFDTVPHNKLLEKLHKIGIRGVGFDLLKSYLTGRTQKVKIMSATGQVLLSNEQPVHCGTLQGSVLGPLLFVIYINELCKARLDKGSIVCYADDTVIFIEGSSWHEVFELANKHLSAVKSWLDHNQLSLNLDKTCYMTFSASEATQPDTQFSLLLGDSTIQKVKHMKYLGITIDQHMKWQLHTKNVASRLRKTLYKFHELRQVVDKQLLRTIYYGIVQSVVQYGIAAWGGAYATYLKEIEKSMKAIIKTALFHPRRYPTDLIYKELNVPTLTQTHFMNLLTTAKSLHNTTVADIHNLNTRSRESNNLYLPRPKCELFKQSPVYLSAKLFNAIPDYMKVLNHRKLKIELKKFLNSKEERELKLLLQ